MSRRIEVKTGERYGKLTIVKEVEGYRRKFQVKCDCGNTTNVILNSLRNGKTTSCGCYNKQVLEERNRTHGLRNHYLYHTWSRMKQRCYNPNCEDYKYYGAVGVTICDRWRYSFPNFLEDVGDRPSPKHSIDRFPDKYGNYEPTNVRWATHSEQMLNRRPYKIKKNSHRSES